MSKNIIFVLFGGLLVFNFYQSFKISELTDKINGLAQTSIQQQEKITQLSEFVGAQAKALTACQETMGGLTDFAVNKSTLGMLGSAGDVIDLMANCNDAVTEFNSIATQNRE